MNEKLWDLIQLFSGKAEIGPGEMAIAQQNLDPDVFAAFKEQVQKGIKMRNPQWI